MPNKKNNSSSNASSNSSSSASTAGATTSASSGMVGDPSRDTMPAGTGRVAGEGVGGVAGVAAGAAIGSAAGPVGTVIGAIAGAIGGWWAGKEMVDRAAAGYSTGADSEFRNRFESQQSESGGRTSYDDARPFYELGYVAAQNPEYSGKPFDEIEPSLRRGWNSDLEQQYGSWNDVRGWVSDAYDTERELHLTRSEEELVIGKRQVKAGEVGLKKTVETEHVTKSVPLMHEEIEVERHAVSDSDANRDDIEIGEQDIRIPLSAEEAVVEKRVVGKEEIVVKKRAVQETKEVEADLRRERIDIDKQGEGDFNDSATDR